MSAALHCDCAEKYGSSDHNLDCLVGSIHAVARALRLLDNADAGTPMGAVEALGAVVQEGFRDIARAINTDRH
jgi:hypothetical protein